MKKRIAILLLAFVLFLFACGQQAPTWQEQYDLGVRYLSEGNYQEAIIAFTAAIEIDSKRSEAYLGTAKAYVEAGSAGKASEILQQGYEKTQDQALLDAIEIRPGDEGRGSSQADPAGLAPLDGYPKTERIEYLSGNGYLILEYDLYGRPSFEESYTSENILDGRRTWEYDDQGRLLTEFSEQFGDYSDASVYYSTNQHYNENHQLVEEVRYHVTFHANNGYPSTTIITYQYLGTQVEIFVTDSCSLCFAHSSKVQKQKAPFFDWSFLSKRGPFAFGSPKISWLGLGARIKSARDITSRALIYFLLQKMGLVANTTVNNMPEAHQSRTNQQESNPVCNHL